MTQTDHSDYKALLMLCNVLGMLECVLEQVTVLMSR